MAPSSTIWPLATRRKVYVLLAIGDGLVAQVPALLLSIAAAMVVTRVGSDDGLAGQVTRQFSGAGNWAPVAVILALLAALPGMPHLVILAAAAGAGAIAWKLRRRDGDAPAAADAGGRQRQHRLVRSVRHGGGQP